MTRAYNVFKTCFDWFANDELFTDAVCIELVYGIVYKVKGKVCHCLISGKVLIVSIRKQKSSLLKKYLSACEIISSD